MDVFKAILESKENSLDLSSKGIKDADCVKIAEALTVFRGVFVREWRLVLLYFVCRVVLGGLPSPVTHPFHVMFLCR